MRLTNVKCSGKQAININALKLVFLESCLLLLPERPLRHPSCRTQRPGRFFGHGYAQKPGLLVVGLRGERGPCLTCK